MGGDEYEKKKKLFDLKSKPLVWIKIVCDDRNEPHQKHSKDIVGGYIFFLFIRNFIYARNVIENEIILFCQNAKRFILGFTMSVFIIFFFCIRIVAHRQTRFGIFFKKSVVNRSCGYYIETAGDSHLFTHDF